MKKGWKNINEVLYFKSLLYVSEIICKELINLFYNNLFASHFRIKKIGELVI